MIGTISIEDVVKGVVVNGENVVDYDGIAKIVIPDPPEVPVKDVKVDGESVVNSEGVANITIPDPPEIPVKDVKVDGESVVNAQGVANITLPDPPEVPVNDVKVNGESVVNAQGVANVVVPVISNLRVVKQLPGVPAAVVTVSDAEAFTIPSLTVGVEAWQEGSGDPSPENIRPIHGWDEVNVTVADDVNNPTVSNVYTIDLNGTRYGGRLEVVNGVAQFVATHGYADLGSLDWTYSRNRLWFYNYSLAIKPNTQNSISSMYAYRSLADVGSDLTLDGVFTVNNTSVCIRNLAYTDATAFKSAMSGVQLVCELAEQIIIPLGNYPISSLEGENNLFADSGEILDGEYVSNQRVVNILN